ncbi:hypothetical protein L226DRAFT_574604 [Lentinus tigrinus ALCF2SS1-7]|uniref:Uncharacterized protein n=1 Tax=Lentinus tigrinus ALCF2SS1-6 TaxID=1328759 RepID=A0A5C2RWP3_9APHY|nr:hypothetical protein L227DRAFT_304169 [Lentinus tigrinus ALCF2SS1-6]RPD70715.1 hypothetical protein L226DRAFT_574604 [Lentinus tigrinus ALCF2SS1-7]
MTDGPLSVQRVGRVMIDGIVNPVTFAAQKPSEHFSHQSACSLTCTRTSSPGAHSPARLAASEGDGPLDIDAKFQALIKAAHDATLANASVPLTSGQFRGQPVTAVFFAEVYVTADWGRYMKKNYIQIVEIG